MNINAPNEDNLCFIKNVLEQGATLIDSPWLFFSFSQEGKLARTHTLRFTHLSHLRVSCSLCGASHPFKGKVSYLTCWLGKKGA